MPLLLLAVLLALAAGGAAAQETAPMPLPRLTAPIRFDGRPDEAAWDSIAPLPLVSLEPRFGEAPTERTEIRVAYDDEYVYASMRGYDSEPSGIRTNTLYRDRYSGDDLFVLFLDTFDDNQSGVSFTINPAGMRRDAAISGDAAGSDYLNVDYNTFWDVKTEVTDAGWFAEARVPFSSLRFQDRDGEVEMGLITFRLIARKSERVTFPALSATTDHAYLKPSLARKVTMKGIYARRPLHVTPYLRGGLDQSFAGPDGSPRTDHLDRAVGADLKYGLTSNLTLDLTANTDFAQVEADDQQVNLTRFSLFFPEKREFFQERASLFDFRTGADGRLFHSRRIGLTDAGEPVRILGGARAIGRVGTWDVGLLEMQTGSHAALPSENFGVLRLRRRVFNAYSYVGGMLTSRVGTDGRYNEAYGLDGDFRLGGDDYLSVVWAQTAERDSLGTRAGLDAGRFTLGLERRRRSGAGYRAIVAWSGAEYDPGMGFARRHDFTLLDQAASYTWLPGRGSPFIWHTLEMAGQAYLRNGDRSVETAEVGPEWRFAARDGGTGSLTAQLVREDLRDPFQLSPDAGVPAGRYTFPQVTAVYKMSRAHLLRTEAEATAGSFYDGWRASLSVSPTWIASRHLELGGAYLYDRVRFPSRDQAFDSHIVRLRVGAAVNTQLSAQSLVQLSTSSHTAGANIRFRYNLREGNDLWIVLNQGMNTDRFRLDPALPRTQSRALLLKYTHTFGI